MVRISGSWDPAEGIKIVHTVPPGKYLVLTDGVFVEGSTTFETTSRGAAWLYQDSVPVTPAIKDFARLRTGLIYPPASTVRLKFEVQVPATSEGYFSLAGYYRTPQQIAATAQLANAVVVMFDGQTLTADYPVGPSVTAYNVPANKRLVLTDLVTTRIAVAGSNPVVYSPVANVLLENAVFSWYAYPDDLLPRLVFQPGSNVSIGLCCSGQVVMRVMYTGYLEDT